jgi:hypothetical protein
MKFLDCFTGQYSMVDDDDNRAWKGFKWGQNSQGYICADFRLKGGKIQRFYLHRLIAKPGPWQQVHHKNRCRWDNRRENLECLSIEEHLKRHPDSKRLLSLAQEQRKAKAQWVQEQQILMLVRDAERAEQR